MKRASGLQQRQVSDSHSIGTSIELRAGIGYTDCVLVVLLSSSRRIAESSFKTGHGKFFTHPLRFYTKLIRLQITYLT